jgi:ADP-ribose pyrophosphatase
MSGPEELIGQGDYLSLHRVGTWEFVRRRGITGIVIVVAATDAGEIVLVEQFRPSVQRRVLELPAGVVGDLPGHRHEDLCDAARRELREETGFEAADVEPLVHGPVSPGLSRDYYTFVRARGLVRRDAGGGDESEDIEVHVTPIADVHAYLDARAAQGVLIDPKILIGLYLLRHEAEARGAVHWNENPAGPQGKRPSGL